MPVDIGGMIIQVIGIIFLLFVVVGGLATKSLKGALIGGGLFIAFVTIALFLTINSSDSNKNAQIDKGLSRWGLLANQAEVNLAKICESEERFVINRLIPAGSDIYLNLYPDHKAPTAQVLPEQNSNLENKNSVDQQSASWAPAPHVQYDEPIRWIEEANQPETIAKLIGSDLLEFRDVSKAADFPYKRLATKRRWEKDGQSAIAVAFTENLLDNYKFRNWPDGKFIQAIPIENPSAQYEFSVVDISTLDDRNNWLARGRIRLLDTTTSSVVAEYIGFQSIVRKSDVCPGAKKAVSKPDGEWDMLRFFFERVIKAPKGEKSKS